MEDGIGSGGLWPSDLLHCDDNNLVRSRCDYVFDVIIVCNWAADGDCNDDDHEKHRKNCECCPGHSLTVNCQLSKPRSL